MIPLLKEVARGKKGSRDLSFSEAAEAAAAIADGTATPAQIGGFLLAERMKGETADEIAAFTKVFRERSRTISVPQGLDCAGAYDGRAHSFFATLPVAAILSSCGIPSILHGSSSLPPKYGVVLEDVLPLLGVNRPEKTPLPEEKSPFYYLSTESHCPPLRHLRKIREELGVRTILNHVEKWLNLANARCIVYGIFHLTALKTAAEVLQRLNIPRGLIVQGTDGSEDLPADRVSRAILVEGDRMEELRIDPGELGLEAPQEKTHLPAEKQAEWIRRVLQGEPGPYRSMVLLNAAVRLWLTGCAKSVKEGLALAREKLDGGEAAQSFAAFCLRCRRKEEEPV